jgi:Flp pilus assembly protein TadD
MQNRAAEAIEPLQRSARRSEDAATETLLGMALDAAGRRDEALEQLQKATTRRPPFYQAFLEQGGLLARLGHLEEAIQVLESGLAFSPDAIDLRMELGYVQIKRNSRTEARALFLQVLAVAPARHDALAALAKVMVLDGEYAAAADLYRRALGLRPDDAASRNSLGMCLLEMGDRNAGEASLRAATRDAPQLAGQAITSLASVSHGRFFLRPSAAVKFLNGEKP